MRSCSAWGEDNQATGDSNDIWFLPFQLHVSAELLVQFYAPPLVFLLLVKPRSMLLSVLIFLTLLSGLGVFFFTSYPKL